MLVTAVELLPQWEIGGEWGSQQQGEEQVTFLPSSPPTAKTTKQRIIRHLSLEALDLGHYLVFFVVVTFLSLPQFPCSEQIQLPKAYAHCDIL